MQKQARLIYVVRTVVTLGGNGDWKGTQGGASGMLIVFCSCCGW